MKFLALLLFGLFFLTACSKKNSSSDASGAFEAVEILISSEAAGILRRFTVEEGRVLKAGDKVGYVDSTQLYLKKKQIASQIKALLSRKPQIGIQLEALQTQWRAAQHELQRVSNLVKAGAATPKQLDEATALVNQLAAQVEAQKSSLAIAATAINEEVVPLQIQMEQIQDQIDKCSIINPITGTVLMKYTEPYELTAPGKPLYKIADLSEIILRVYISGNQLPDIKLNQPVQVMTDDGQGGYKVTKGVISWINDKAEFTPKTIQTKDERANRVYAVKVRVRNDGSYKIGMYGEVKFQ